MIRRLDAQHSFTRSPGADIRVLVEPNEMYDAGRLYALITVAPGASLAYHRHDDEMESYYIVKGTCCVSDNGDTAYLNPGDVMVTKAGECHSISNETSEPVELVAQIISCKQGVPGKGVTI